MELLLEGSALNMLMRVQDDSGEEQDAADAEVPADESVHGVLLPGRSSLTVGTSARERCTRSLRWEVAPVVLGACTQVQEPQLRETGGVVEPVIRVVLADDHPVVIAGLRALLGSLAASTSWVRRPTVRPSYARSS